LGRRHARREENYDPSGYREWTTRPAGPGEPAAGQPCARGRQCAEADYQGNPSAGPRPWCEKDRGYIGQAITGMPETYVRLHFLLAASQQAEERVTGSREAPIPLATDIEAFLAQIVDVAAGWEEAVQATARLADPPGGHRRPGVILGDACRTLSGHLGTLLALAPAEYRRHATYQRVTDIIEESGDSPDDGVVRYDTAGDAWETVTLDGTDAGLEFLRLNGRARGMLGLSRQRRRITEVPCDECQAATLVQWEGFTGGWDPVIKCTACPNAYAGPRFELLMGRVYRVQVDQLKAHGHAA